MVDIPLSRYITYSPQALPQYNVNSNEINTNTNANRVPSLHGRMRPSNLCFHAGDVDVAVQRAVQAVEHGDRVLLVIPLAFRPEVEDSVAKHMHDWVKKAETSGHPPLWNAHIMYATSNAVAQAKAATASPPQTSAGAPRKPDAVPPTLVQLLEKMHNPFFSNGRPQPAYDRLIICGIDVLCSKNVDRAPVSSDKGPTLAVDVAVLDWAVALARVNSRLKVVDIGFAGLQEGADLVAVTKALPPGPLKSFLTRCGLTAV